MRGLSLFGVVVLFRLIACLLLNAECVKSISIFWDLSGFSWMLNKNALPGAGRNPGSIERSYRRGGAEPPAEPRDSTSSFHMSGPFE
jgi:hypothetical protein